MPHSGTCTLLFISLSHRTTINNKLHIKFQKFGHILHQWFIFEKILQKEVAIISCFVHVPCTVKQVSHESAMYKINTVVTRQLWTLAEWGLWYQRSPFTRQYCVCTRKRPVKKDKIGFLCNVHDTWEHFRNTCNNFTDVLQRPCTCIRIWEPTHSKLSKVRLIEIVFVGYLSNKNI